MNGASWMPQGIRDLMAYASTAVVGFLNTPIGLGESARRQFRALKSVHHPVTAHSIPLPHMSYIAYPGVETAAPPDDVNVIAHVNPPEWLADQRLRELVARGRHYMIGYWHWELPVFPLAWMEALYLAHEIWVPTRFCADAYHGHKRPVRVVPHPVPLNTTPKDVARATLGLPQDRFIFLSISDTGSFPQRKNPAGAARAFVDAFARNASTAPLLVLKIQGTSNRTPEFARFVEQMREHPLVHVIDETVSDETVRNLQAACDCFVSLHRSEGFGFNIAESMAAGRLAIATDFSGNVDFMNAENSIPIPYKLRPVQASDYLNGQGQYWAEPNHEAAVEAMRWVVDHRDEAEALGRQAQAYMAANHSFESIGKRAISTLKSAGITYRVPLAQPVVAKRIPTLRVPAGAPPPMPLAVERNAPCPCGSGKRYKHCHGH